MTADARPPSRRGSDGVPQPIDDAPSRAIAVALPRGARARTRARTLRWRDRLRGRRCCATAARRIRAMLDAIAAAQRSICLETYILASDATGDRFKARADRARARRRHGPPDLRRGRLVRRSSTAGSTSCARPGVRGHRVQPDRAVARGGSTCRTATTARSSSSTTRSRSPAGSTSPTTTRRSTTAAPAGTTCTAACAARSCSTSRACSAARGSRAGGDAVPAPPRAEHRAGDRRHARRAHAREHGGAGSAARSAARTCT